MKIALIGDFDLNRPSHVATSECVQRTGDYLSKQIEVQWIPTHSLENSDTLVELQGFDGIWGAPGNHDSLLGTINAIQVSRENNIPYLGT